MKVKYSNFVSLYHKTKRFGFYIPFTNFLLVHCAKILPARFLDKISLSRNQRNYSAPPMGMSNRLTVVLQQELH